MHPTCSTMLVGLATVVFTACAPGTDGLVEIEAGQDEAALDLTEGPIIIELPTIPAIALPDLGDYRTYEGLVDERVLGLDVDPIVGVGGVEIVEGECEGDLVYEGDQTSAVFADASLRSNDSVRFAVDRDTSESTYRSSNAGLATHIVTRPDGSGALVEQGRDHHLSIEAEADGSGVYYSEIGSTMISIEADRGGSGTYTRRHVDPDSRLETLTTITLNPNGSGELFHDAPGVLLTVDARSTGTGELFLDQAGRIVTVRVRGDGVWEYSDTSFDRTQSVVVNPDGSGQFHDRAPGRSFKLDFGADGTSSSRGQPGPKVLVPAAPTFVVSDRFPALGTLDYIKAPCVASTILRFDSALLFADNDHGVLSEAQQLLADLAPSLLATTEPFEIHGHTDARGTEQHNQSLSELRALEVAKVLHAHGVPLEQMSVQGFGETRPVAPNYIDDGSDDPGGQAQNRRVEIVIGT